MNITIQILINDTNYIMNDNELLVEGANINASNTVKFKVLYKDNGVNKEFTSLKTINVRTIALPPEITVTVSEVTSSSITFLVTLKSNGSTIIESYFAFDENPRLLSVGDDNVITYTDLEAGTNYSYTAIVNYNDETGVKFYTFPKAEIKTKSKGGCSTNLGNIILLFGAISISVYLIRKKH